MIRTEMKITLSTDDAGEPAEVSDSFVFQMPYGITESSVENFKNSAAGAIDVAVALEHLFERLLRELEERRGRAERAEDEPDEEANANAEVEQ